jgi:hypothetical protein
MIKILHLSRVVDPDPDPYWIRIQSGLWIRIRIRDPDPDPGGQKLPTKVDNNLLYRTSGVIFFIDYCTAIRDT